MIDKSHLPVTLQQGDALLVVDVQTDFLPGGALAVPNGDAVVAVMNGYLSIFSDYGLPIFASRDWHPTEHCSFLEQGGSWPPHCVAETSGAAFAVGLKLPESTAIISKATQREVDAYSAFQDTGLTQQLQERGIRRLFVGGLATDYCVLHTVRDARKAGFEVYLLEDAIRAVEVSRGDGERAVAEMIKVGAVVIGLEQAA